MSLTPSEQPNDVALRSLNSPSSKHRRPPMFTIDLQVATAEDGGERVQRFSYSHDPSQFVEHPLTMFDAMLSSIRNIVKLERLLMEDLFWSHDPTLEVVRPVEEWVQTLRRGISANLARAVSPLSGYLSTYAAGLL